MSATLTNTTSQTQSVDGKAGQSAGAFAASLVTSIVIFAVELLAFLLIKDRFSRIYAPRTYLVPEKERTVPPSVGWYKWIKAVLNTSNTEFIQKCGLDAYFFLRYMRTLLKIFVPAALVILPVLLPINAVGGRGPDYALHHEGSTNVTGLDVLAWGNVAPNHTGRYWAHFLLALALISWVCYVSFDELRVYIRMRQAYITSPQHRLRASATTVLVGSIPARWCTLETLDGLYDVFPGGLRNIWINRNFDELSNKVKKRDKLASALESAETALIRKCFKKHLEEVSKLDKKAGYNFSKEEKKRQSTIQDDRAARNAVGQGLSSGNPHQVSHNVQDATDGPTDSRTSSDAEEEPQLQPKRSRPAIPIPIIGDGIEAVGRGFGKFGKGVIGGIKGVNKGLNNTMDTTNGFVVQDQPKDAVPEDWTEQHLHRYHTNRSHVNRKPVGGTKNQNTDLSPASPIDSRADWNRGRTTVRPENDRQPLGQPSPTTEFESNDQTSDVRPQGKLAAMKKVVGINGEKKESVEYPPSFDPTCANDAEDAVWKQYLEEKDRDTMRLPVVGWMPSLPLLGEKVDTIYYCRKEVARLNLEIEDDQAHPERFPLMNSAFIQFNHQVAAHMACQSVSHHLPQQMAPRLVEIDPNDVVWDNMSIPWWQIYIRTTAVLTLVAAMIILWAIPVAFTSALSQLSYLASAYKWLHWLETAPNIVINILQGVLPATFLAILMFLLPVALRFLVKLQGTQSGMLIELAVQRYYFFFLFVQLFLVVTIASAVSTLFSVFKNVNSITSIPNVLAQNIPKASNYFFSYMLLQALSVSAGALLQVGSLISWFVLAPLLDSTARAKFQRQTQLSDIKWGTFFPVYTNLACIGLIYSVISPLILLFNIITFSLFWFVYRYNTLYVTKFTRDTGGLLYPNAINCTFTGLYVMEVALIGLFFLVRDSQGNVACTGQAIGMVVIAILTAAFQWLLNDAFSPLFRYLPITLEDDAVRRDEEFARAMHKKQIGLIEDEIEGEDLEDQLERRERQSLEEDRNAQQYEMQQIESQKRERLQQLRSQELPPLEPYEFQNPEINMDFGTESKGYRIMRKTAQKTANATINKLTLPSVGQGERRSSSWADRNNSQNRRSKAFGQYANPSQERSDSFSTESRHHHSITHRTRKKSPGRQALDRLNNLNPLVGNREDLEAQQAARNQLSDALFAGLNDELEDLTPEQRDTLVQRAFQHAALRARRPVIWLPRDDLGVSDDEVRRMGAFSKNLWISNVRQGLDSKGRCVYSGAPPDFSEVDLIQL